MLKWLSILRISTLLGLSFEKLIITDNSRNFPFVIWTWMILSHPEILLGIAVAKYKNHLYFAITIKLHEIQALRLSHIFCAHIKGLSFIIIPYLSCQKDCFGLNIIFWQSFLVFLVLLQQLLNIANIKYKKNKIIK